MRNVPYLWFKNIATIQEKKRYSIIVIFLFSAFVGAVRLLGEWLLGGRVIMAPLADYLGFTVFYWYCFFTYALILRLLIKQSWRISINVILIGIFCGLLPPLIDVWIYGIGNFRYSYFWGFPTEWSPWIYNPTRKIPFGESLVLWFTVIFTALYVRLRTASIVKTGLAAVLAYGVVLLNGAILATALRAFTTELGWSPEQLVFLLPCTQVMVVLFIYLALQPRLALGLFFRIHHAFPFVAMSLVGAAFMGGIYADTLIYAFLLLLAFAVALAHNDYFDTEEDSLQGRVSYADAEDLHFLNLTFAIVLALMLAVSTIVGILLSIIVILSFLYSYPFYRGKKFFPSNLKMEGMWGAASFMVGMVSSIEHQNYGHPRWLAGMSAGNPFSPPQFSADALIAVALIFAGYSVVAALKDYKDWEADLAAGVQTIYTLAHKRGRSTIRVHLVLIAAASICLLAPFPLLISVDRIPVEHFGIGVVFAIALLASMLKLKPRQGFDVLLFLLTLYFAYFIVILAFPSFIT